jgi:PAS domain S-box-containing protein
MRRNASTESTHREPLENQMLALVDASDVAIIGKSLDNVIVSWNRGAEKIYGYTAVEAVGQPITLLTPPERHHEPAELIERVRRGERIEHLETVRVARDGRRIHIDLMISPARNVRGEITGALLIARDITGQVQARRELQRLQESAAQRALMLETANQVALDILTSRTGIEALQHIVEAARTLSQARYAALVVANPNGQGLAAFVTTGLTPEEEAAVGLRPKGAGILGLLLARTQPLRIEELSAHPASVGFPPNHPPMRTFLGVPIRRGEETLGSLYLTDKEGGPFTEADAIAVQALGAHAAVAIYHLHLLSRQRALVSGLIAAQEEERRAVAYDLHDGLTQYVMASHAHMEAYRKARETGKEERAVREMEQGLRYLKEAVVESRRMVNGLRTLALDDLGLAGTLEQLLAEEKMRADWQEADFLHNIAGQRFHRDLETTVYRVAQEALTNARKHAEGTRVRLSLLLGAARPDGPPLLTLEIRDWGKGFVPEQRASAIGHVGLQSMVERVQLMGGTYTLQSAPGEGTRIRAILPALEPPPEKDERDPA